MGRGNSRGRGGRGGGGDRDSGDRNRADERGPPSNRGKDKDDRGGRGGPSKNSMRGMGYIHPKTPSFLEAFKAQLTGGPPPNANGQYEAAGPSSDAGGRAALPSGRGDRQTSEDREKEDRERERDEDEWGFGEGDEAPQVVAVKEGRHITQLEMENERRKAKGLPPLPADSSSSTDPSSSTSASSAKPPPKTSATTTTTSTAGAKTAKRKAVAVGGDVVTAAGGSEPKKKAKKEKKGLLSFDEEEG